MNKFKREDIIFLVAALIIFVLRIWVAREIGVFIISESLYDDFLMMHYANFYEHFVAQNVPYNLLLIKDMGFPVFLHFVQFSGVSYIDWMSFLWLIAAALMTWLFVLVTGVKDRRILFLIYVFVLFTPVAFSGTGRRIYRQAFLSQAYFITLTMMTIFFVFYWNKIKISIAKLIFFSIIFGGVFTLTFYVKEDGIWLLMCLAVALFCTLIKNFYNGGDLKNKLTHALIIFLPLIIFAAGTVFYKSVNEKYFGVYLINDRTEGELGRFVKNAYKIKSDERTNKHWAPTDVIVKLFETSETLRNNENLREHVFHSGWLQLDITKTPIHGDFLNWVMMSALYDSGTCKTVVEQEEFLKKVNAEIEAAFDAGILQKDDKFQLVSSMGGYSLKEIFDLRKLIGKIYKAHLLTAGYKNTFEEDQVAYLKNSEGVIEAATKERFRPELENISAIIHRDLFFERNNFEQRETLTNIIFKIYAVINPVLFLAAFISLFKTADFSREFLQYLLIAGFFLLSLVYAFAIAWFSSFMGFSAALFYSNGIIPMLAIFEIFGAYRLYKFVKGN